MPPAKSAAKNARKPLPAEPHSSVSTGTVSRASLEPSSTGRGTDVDIEPAPGTSPSDPASSQPPQPSLKHHPSLSASYPIPVHTETQQTPTNPSSDPSNDPSSSSGFHLPSATSPHSSHLFSDAELRRLYAAGTPPIRSLAASPQLSRMNSRGRPEADLTGEEGKGVGRTVSYLQVHSPRGLDLGGGGGSGSGEEVVLRKGRDGGWVVVDKRGGGEARGRAAESAGAAGAGARARARAGVAGGRGAEGETSPGTATVVEDGEGEVRSEISELSASESVRRPVGARRRTGDMAAGSMGAGNSGRGSAVEERSREPSARTQGSRKRGTEDQSWD